MKTAVMILTVHTNYNVSTEDVDSVDGGEQDDVALTDDASDDF